MKDSTADTHDVGRPRHSPAHHYHLHAERIVEVAAGSRYGNRDLFSTTECAPDGKKVFVHLRNAQRALLEAVQDKMRDAVCGKNYRVAFALGQLFEAYGGKGAAELFSRMMNDSQGTQPSVQQRRAA